MCPYYLDGDLGESTKLSPGDTRFIGYCAVFKVREEARPGTLRRAGLSKLNSMRAPDCAAKATTLCAPPDSVDVLEADRARPAGRELRISEP